MNSDEFRKAAHSAVEQVIEYYETIQDRQVLSNVTPGYLNKLLPSSLPEEGEEWGEIEKDIDSKIMPGLTHWQSPNFMAYFPACSTYPSMLGELYSAAFTAPAFNWICSPAVTELETIVLDWLAKLMKLPPCFLSKGEGGGVIQGSASEAIVTVMVAARERAINAACVGLQGQELEESKARIRGRLVALGTAESHSSTVKAAIIVGVRYISIPVHVTDNLALTGLGLQSVLEDCERDDLVPFYLTVTLGTTGTCAVDRFGEVKEVALSHPQLWVHVDAAYAGAALVCEEYQYLTTHLDAFNSFDMNMHKWLLTNFDASCLYVKRRIDLTSALTITPTYLSNSFSSSGLVIDYRDWQIPLGRRFRSLKIWFVLRTYGISGLKSHVRKGIKLGELFHSLVLSRPDLFRVLAPPAFALTVLAVLPRRSKQRLTSERIGDGVQATNDIVINGDFSELDSANKITKEVLDQINASGQLYLTGTVVNDIYAIRVVSANELADEEHVRRAFQILVLVTEEVLVTRELG